MCISNLSERHAKNFKESAISDQLLRCGYVIDIDLFDIVASNTNKILLHIKESLFIKRHRPALNRTIKSFLLKL